MDLISLVVVLVVIALMFWALRTLAPALGLPQPVVTVLYVALVIIVCLWLLRVLVGFNPQLGV